MLTQLLKRLGVGSPLPKKLSYVEAKDALETHSMKARKELAARTDAKPEMLYYLAEDESAEVRALVAANPTTPVQADRLLATDEDDHVRTELALKIGRLVPGLDVEEALKLREQTIEVLEQLANDHLPRVRQIIAEELKGSADVPARLIKQLAKDIEAIVAVPILEYSPLLADEDLLEIIASGAASEALQAIAHRNEVSGQVSDAIVTTLDVPAVAALLVNPNAQIREETLDQIVQNAEDIEAWHKPLVMRPDLSVRAIRRIAGFVASSLISILCERNELDDETLTELRDRVRERIKTENSLSADEAEDTDRARQVARDAHNERRLDDTFVTEAAKGGDRVLVVEALALLTGYAPSLIGRILDSQQGKVITAMVWRAGLSMRVALKVQMLIAKVQPNYMVMARDGVDFPLTPDEMEWHLSHFEKTM